MANALYPYGKSEMLKGNIDLLSDTINVALVAGYSYSSSHTNYTTHISSFVVGTPVALGSKTVSATGVFDADDVTFTAVPSGSTVNAFIIYKSSDGTLIGHVDTGTGLTGGFPTNGSNITITFSSGGSKIFAL